MLIIVDQRIVILRTRSRSGFLPNAKVLFKAGLPSGDYHGQMNSVHTEQELESKARVLVVLYV